MKNDEIRTKVLEILAKVIPELEPDKLDPAKSIRDQLDIDSMDFLNYATGLSKSFGIEIPETDYRHLFTVDDCVKYVAGRAKT